MRAAEVLLLTATLAGCGSAAESEESRLEPVRLATSRYLTNAPLLIAAEAGYFADEGLEVEFLDAIAGTSQLVPALSQGRLDVLGSANSIGLLNAIGREGEIKLVADKGHYAPGGCSSLAIVARRGLLPPGAVASAKDLRGRRFAMGDASSGNRYFFEALLDSLGLREEEVVLRDIPSIGHLEALNTGAVDFVRALEPSLTHLQAAGHQMVLPGEDVLPYFQIGTIAFGPRLLGEDRELGRRFVRAYLRAIRQYNQGKTDRNLELLARATRLDRALLERVCWPAVREDGRLSVESLMAHQRWAVKKGFLEQAFPAERLWDRSFVDSAAADLAEAR